MAQFGTQDDVGQSGRRKFDFAEQINLATSILESGNRAAFRLRYFMNP